MSCHERRRRSWASKLLGRACISVIRLATSILSCTCALCADTVYMFHILSSSCTSSSLYLAFDQLILLLSAPTKVPRPVKAYRVLSGTHCRTIYYRTWVFQLFRLYSNNWTVLYSQRTHSALSRPCKHWGEMKTVGEAAE